MPENVQLFNNSYIPQLRELEAKGVSVRNSPRVVGWNANKGYLSTVRTHSEVRVIETAFVTAAGSGILSGATRSLPGQPLVVSCDGAGKEENAVELAAMALFQDLHDGRI